MIKSKLLATKKRSPVLFSKKFQSTRHSTSQNNGSTQSTSPINKKNTESDSSLRSTLVIFLLSGTFIILIAFLGEYGILTHQLIKQKEVGLTEEIERLHQKEQNLLQEIDALQNNKNYLEALARKELGLVKKNEIIYFFKTKNKESEPHQ